MICINAQAFFFGYNSWLFTLCKTTGLRVTADPCLVLYGPNVRKINAMFMQRAMHLSRIQLGLYFVVFLSLMSFFH